MSRLSHLKTILALALAGSAATPLGSAFALSPLAVPGDPSLLVRVQASEPYSRLLNGGYRVNRYGYGRYTRGTAGGFGGYPAGSVGAQELREQQERKCRDVPEEC